MPPGGRTGRERSFAADGIPLRIVLDVAGTTAYLAVSGELDHISAELLATALDAAMTETTEEVVADLDHLVFCDAGGVGCFLDSAERLRSEGRSLHLKNAAPNVARVFRILQADFLIDNAEGG
jgi:anti-anti-sigma factor